MAKAKNVEVAVPIIATTPPIMVQAPLRATNQPLHNPTPIERGNNNNVIAGANNATTLATFAIIGCASLNFAIQSAITPTTFIPTSKTCPAVSIKGSKAFANLFFVVSHSFCNPSSAFIAALNNTP